MEKADLTWVFIVGGAGVLLIGLIILYFCCNVRTQSKITEEVKKERAQGIMPVWGTKRRRAPILQEPEIQPNYDDSSRRVMIKNNEHELSTHRGSIGLDAGVMS